MSDVSVRAAWQWAWNGRVVSGEILSNALDQPIDMFCYPKGFSDARVREITARYYRGACSDKLGIASAGSDLFALERVEMFYLRSARSAQALTKPWFEAYLKARNVPRTAKRALQRRRMWEAAS